MAAPTPGLTTTESSGRTVLAFAGRLDAGSVAGLWGHALGVARRARDRALALDLSRVETCDMAGAAMLAAVERAHGEPPTLIGANQRVSALLARARQAGAPVRQVPPLPSPSTREMLRTGLSAAGSGVVFLGEAVLAAIRLPGRRRMFRWADLLRYTDQAGVRSLPLVLMLGFLMGLILAFQSAIPMREFGAEQFVANLVSVSLTRELGPLLAAVILAGRTGSAFAAEIGTMKVNEELDALVTMGLDPMTMLVLPRLVAGLIVMPVMTVVLDLAGLLGMAVVMRGFGYPLSIVEAQVQYWTTPGDLYGGLVKAACFGAVIAAIGCRAGLGTGKGPRAVGVSTTAAVVGGIVATIVLDGVFAVFMNRLGI